MPKTIVVRTGGPTAISNNRVSKVFDFIGSRLRTKWGKDGNTCFNREELEDELNIVLYASEIIAVTKQLRESPLNKEFKFHTKDSGTTVVATPRK